MERLKPNIAIWHPIGSKEVGEEPTTVPGRALVQILRFIGRHST